MSNWGPITLALNIGAPFHPIYNWFSKRPCSLVCESAGTRFISVRRFVKRQVSKCFPNSNHPQSFASLGGCPFGWTEVCDRINGDGRINGLVISPTYKWVMNWGYNPLIHKLCLMLLEMAGQPTYPVGLP